MTENKGVAMITSTQKSAQTVWNGIVEKKKMPRLAHSDGPNRYWQ